ncbi:MAG: hypothetical protein RIF41_01465 [Polyangiaceae bacterium]
MDHPGIRGSVTLTLRVDAEGRVSQVGGGGGPLAPIMPCLENVARSLVFAPPATGRAIVSIPLTFLADR